jgi:hypothetical protein
MRHPKTWDDQPEAVMDGEPLCTFVASTPDSTVVVEIRRVDYESYRLVTVGNLLASQTIQCGDDCAVYRLLDSLGKGGGRTPMGCELVE